MINVPKHLVDQVRLTGKAAECPETIEVFIDPSSKIKRIQLSISEINCIVQIGPNVAAEMMTVVMGAPNSSLKIGKNTLINSFYVSFPEPSLALDIGQGCLISHSITFRPSDHHPIFSLKTHELINPGKSITIGDNVWIAEQVTVLKGTRVGYGAVLGAREALGNRGLSGP